MKKIISVLLALLCLCSFVSVIASAENNSIADLIKEEAGLDQKEDQVYVVVFHNGDAKTMYSPPCEVNLDGPGVLRLSEDEPIAIGKDFRCWKDENGRDVFPGSEIEVNGIVHLYASWANSSSKVTAIDTIICAFKVMIHSIQIAIKIIDTANHFRATPRTPTTPIVVEEEE